MSEVQDYTDDATRFAEMGTKRFVESSRYALNVSLGIQKVVLDEMTKASDEVLECLRTEIEIASEFIARLASAGSVREIASAYDDCGQHQAEAFRSDSQMLLTHSQRVCERTSKLFASEQPPN